MKCLLRMSVSRLPIVGCNVDGFVLPIASWTRLVHADPDAPEEGQADVLLGAIPVVGRPQDVLPRHQVQQEQYCAAGQVVLELPVSSVFFLVL